MSFFTRPAKQAYIRIQYTYVYAIIQTYTARLHTYTDTRKRTDLRTYVFIEKSVYISLSVRSSLISFYRVTRYHVIFHVFVQLESALYVTRRRCRLQANNDQLIFDLFGREMNFNRKSDPKNTAYILLFFINY